MSLRDAPKAIRDMISYAEDARSFAGSDPSSTFATDKLRRYAILRALEVVGEAATRVPEDVRARAPGVPWSAIIALRNRLIHGYDSVDEDRVGRIVSAQIPVLVQQLRGLLAELEP